MINKILSFIFTIFAGVAVASGAAFAALSYSGSSTIGMGILVAGALQAFEEKTRIRFTSIDMSGSGKGLRALQNGKTSLAGVSRALSPKEKGQDLVGTVIGHDAIAVFVHSNNPVGNLSKEQLKGIFTGRIRNWKQIGGKNAPIQPNTEIAGEERATMLAFQELAMDNTPYGNGFKQIDFPSDQIIETAKNENAICTVSMGLLSQLTPYMRTKVKVLGVNGVWVQETSVVSGSYPLSRPLLLVTKGRPKGEAKQFIDFMLSPEGQRFVAKNFVRVKQ